MRFSMLYSGEQILPFKPCLVFYAGDSLRVLGSSASVLSKHVTKGTFDYFFYNVDNSRTFVSIFKTIGII